MRMRVMKRILILLALLMTVSLCACGGNNDDLTAGNAATADNQDSETDNAQAWTDEPTGENGENNSADKNDSKAPETDTQSTPTVDLPKFVF